MIQIKDILKKIGFASGISQFGAPTFKYRSEISEIIATYLDMIPSLSLTAGFNIQVRYFNNRILAFEGNNIPKQAANWEQGLAMIYLGIGKNEKDIFDTTPEWYIIGRESVDLLPFYAARKKAQEEYALLPKVYVEPAWLRVLIKMLKEWKLNLSDQTAIVFSFNGEFLNFSSGNNKIPIPATGTQWVREYQFNFAGITMLPKRIYQKDGMLLIKDNFLIIGDAKIYVDIV